MIEIQYLIYTNHLVFDIVCLCGNAVLRFVVCSIATKSVRFFFSTSVFWIVFARMSGQTGPHGCFLIDTKEELNIEAQFHCVD